ncbi:MAG: FAD-binding oxidoreductase [Candidatus Thorarchaeota archaeon]
MVTNRIKAEQVKASKLDAIRVVDGEETICESCSDYLTDEARFGDGHAERLFYARSEADVIAVVKWAKEHKIPITISAGRTGLTGGAVPQGGILLSLEQMDKLCSLGFDETKNKWFICAQPGVTLEALNSAVYKRQLDSLKTQCTDDEQAALDKFLADSSTHFFPPDPTEMTAHLGGSLAANASGARSFRYKAIRQWTKRLRIVLSNGDVLDISRGTVFAKGGQFVIELTDGTINEITIPTYDMPSTKNAAGLFAHQGMDLIDLFIGSEGILGIITEAEVWLEVYPERSLTIFAFFPTEKAALAFVRDIRSESSLVQPTLVEYFDSNAVQMLRDARIKGLAGVTVPPQVEKAEAIIFFEIPFVEAEMESTFMAAQELLGKYEIGMDDTWAGIDPGDLDKMKAVRHLIPETVNSLIAQRKQKHPRVHKLGTDMAVPDEHMETMISYYKKTLDEAGMEYIMFGHIGDNHLHVNILPRTDDEVDEGMNIYKQFAKKAVELGGTVSAEHGIGKLKRPFLRIMYGDEGLEEMAVVKRALDPEWILNPGNMIPRPGETLESVEA